MSARPAALEVAEVVRPHGLKGGVVVALLSSEQDRLVPGAVLLAGESTLLVRSSRRLKDRYVVEFEGVETKEAAEALRGTKLSAPPREVDGALWVDQLIGATVTDPAGAVLGVVSSVEANPASDLLVLDNGGLVPVRFVVGGVDEGRVVVEIPEGLL